jgi:hypothetical protein
MRAIAAALLLALVSVFATSSPALAEAPVVVDMQIDSPDQVTVGDRLTYVITIEADGGVEFSLVQSSLPAELEVVGTPRTTSRSLGNGRVEIKLTFQLAVFVPGDVIVPPLSLRYFGKDIEGGSIQTQASRISVASVLPSGGDVEPRDLKPQAKLGLGSPAWVAPAVAAASIALIVVGTLLLWRVRILRRRAAYVPAPAIVAEVPEDRARVVLDRTGVDFGADGDYVVYYRSIGVTVRSYLTERYGFPAFALTTRELESEMLRRGLDRWQVRVAGGLLTQCDSVVYAHYRPAAERADADLTAAYEIVEMSRPEDLAPAGAPS